jgi:hypothetical protein
MDSMRNLGYLELSPNRQMYDAVLKTQSILRQSDAVSIGLAEISSAVKEACVAVGANPMRVLKFIAGKQRSKIAELRKPSELSAKEIYLKMADVNRAVAVARRDLHDTALAENWLNAEALEVVSAMDELHPAYNKDGKGNALHQQVKLAASEAFGFDVSLTLAERGVHPDQLGYGHDVERRVTDFFRVVAKDHPRTDMDRGESWTKYLDEPFTAFDLAERQAQVHRRLVVPAQKVIAQRILEIDEIIAETAAPGRRSVTAKLRASAKSLLGRSGPNQIAL